MLMSKAFVSAILAAILALACGPAAPPAEPPPEPTAGNPQVLTALTPDLPTPEEPLTQDRELEEAPPAPGTTAGLKPEPEPMPTIEISPSGEKPTPTQEPDPTPGFTPGLKPAPEPEHPYGLEGCKRIATYRDHPSLRHQDWCSDELAQHINDSCEDLSGADAQRQCGLAIVAEYDSALYRLGPIRCYGIEGDARDDCVQESFEDFFSVQEAQVAAWERIRTAAQRDQEVATRLDATVACLEDAGFPSVNPGLLLHWQHGLFPDEYEEREAALTEAEKDLREQIHEPSRACATQEGLFAAQDAAWLAELRRLQQTEPEAVADLIREGFLEALERPGEPTFITGDRPPHKTP